MNRLLPVTALLMAGLASTAAFGQQVQPTPTPPIQAAPPTMDDLRGIRLKISAADLSSAESILEVHRTRKGEDPEYLLGLAWLARGSALMGDWPTASRYAKAARDLAVSRLGTPPDWEHATGAQYALGTSIEVEAQALVAAGKKAQALRFLDESARDHQAAPYNLRARIQKRRNQIELVGKKAPDFHVEDRIGPDFASLDALRGKPVVLFFWLEGCGDCKAQSETFRRAVEKYAPKGVAFVAPTRFYEENRSEEKAKIEKSWSELYGLTELVAVPISDEGMLRYGVSATPTFAFVDRRGVVVQYLPYRMTDERLSAAIENLLR